MIDPLPTSPSEAPSPAPRWWRKHATALQAIAVFITTVALTSQAFPPSRTPEFAYIFALPALYWAYLRPSFRLYAVTVLGAHALAYTILLGWLHHVTIGGLLLLGPFIGAWIGAWFLAAHWTLPRLPTLSAPLRIMSIFALAGLWVVGEWTRTWVLGGFPWISLATSQWQRTPILQIASFTGAGGISFLLIAMNLGFAAYAHRLLRESRSQLSRRSPEFFAALFLLIICVAPQIAETFNRHRYAVPLGKISFVQPYIPQDLKWDDTKAPDILHTLERLTLTAAETRPDLILWPEATTPYALRGDANMQAWVEHLVTRAGTPLLLGSIARQPSATHPAEDDWLNSVFVVSPTLGVQPHFYSKRKLVPFGEYVPLRPLLGWLSKFAPIGDDFLHGTNTTPLLVPLRDRPVGFGPLLCYEDIFPHLSRESVLAGADVLIVNTNNGWFGEGAAAYQHAANSVLRAVETRRPVLRCGNGGWSGWIDEFGCIRSVLTQNPTSGEISTASPQLAPAGTIYFRGTGTIDVTRDSRWIGQTSFYVRHGNWFVLTCTLLTVGAFLLIRTRSKQTP